MAKKKEDYIDLDENRYGLFYSENSFNLDIMYGRHYIETDVRFIFKLYRINIIESKSHDLYGQSKPKNKKYFTPVDIHAIIDIDDGTQEYLGGEQGISREDIGKIIIGVYLSELEEKNVEINRGDVIEYNLSGIKNRYFEVENANNVTDLTSQTIAGFKPYFKKITAVPIKGDVILNLSDDNLV